MNTSLINTIFFDFRYNSNFTIGAMGRIRKGVVLVKMIYADKPHLTNWMGLNELNYNIQAKQYLPIPSDAR